MSVTDDAAKMTDPFAEVTRAAEVNDLDGAALGVTQ
jgi:hypothetical protein